MASDASPQPALSLSRKGWSYACSHRERERGSDRCTRLGRTSLVASAVQCVPSTGVVMVVFADTRRDLHSGGIAGMLQKVYHGTPPIVRTCTTTNCSWSSCLGATVSPNTK